MVDVHEAASMQTGQAPVGPASRGLCGISVAASAARCDRKTAGAAGRSDIGGKNCGLLCALQRQRGGCEWHSVLGADYVESVPHGMRMKSP